MENTVKKVNIVVKEDSSFMDLVKQLEKVDKKLKDNNVSRICDAAEWYWCRQNLEKELTEAQENYVISIARDIYMDTYSNSEVAIMDEIVERINALEDEDVEEYIHETLLTSEERDDILDASENR